jgi:hypothetical protein
MLIWINGPFGVGKSTVARRLLKLRPGLRLFDPERVGFLLRTLWPAEEVPDFQDLPIWREVVTGILEAAASDPARPIVVPMTLASSAYHEEMIGGLRAQGVDVRHFTLMAPAATVRRRNLLRLVNLRSKRWALARVEPCLAALAEPRFATHVDAHRRSPAAIAREILASLVPGAA